MRRKAISWALVVALLLTGLVLEAVKMRMAYADSGDSPKCTQDCPP